MTSDPPSIWHRPAAVTPGDLKRLLAVPSVPPPADFGAFWSATYDEACSVTLGLQRTPSSASVPGFHVEEVSFNSWGGRRLHAWFALPLNHPAPTRGLIISHGYGGRLKPDPVPLLPDAAMLFPCARGISLSATAADRADATPHVLRGIASRETYVLRGCVADVWTSVSALQALSPSAASRIDYVGSSFGGGIGALALPWETRIRRAFLGVPTFGNQPLRLRLPCTGSGAHVQRHVAAHPEVSAVLAYFDASSAARCIHQPVLVECAWRDEVVPPAGQFSVFNGLAGPRHLWLREASHCTYPNGADEDAAVRRAIGRHLNE